MGFLNPAWLLLAAAVAVPLILHLIHRQQGPRMVFPALRYLRRAEREHARRIKLRQLLLLALRLALLLLVALAAARPFLRGGGAQHPPTAVAIILDNSLSGGAIVNDRRVLDRLQEQALETLRRAGPDDRFWLIRAGAPWEAALPGDAATTAARVRETGIAAGEVDLRQEIARARALLEAGADGRAAEIHVLTDLQATGFRARELAADEKSPPLLIWSPDGAPPPNAGIAAVQVGGGLAPRAGERSTVSAVVAASAAIDSVTVRLALDGRIGAAAVASLAGVEGRPEAVASLPFPPRSAGLVSGWVEIDADALRADDRRYFVVRVEPPPRVALTQPLEFVGNALDVLADAGRIQQSAPGAAEIVIAPSATGIERLRPEQSAIILAPTTPLELPAANNRLASAGLPWRFAPAPARGEARFRVDGDDELLRTLESVRLLEVYQLRREGDAGAAPADSVLLRLQDGAPWAVRSRVPGRADVLVVASPLTREAGTLPTSAAMVPLLDRLVGSWMAAEAPRAEARPGGVVTVPPQAETVERPDGERERVRGGTAYRVPGETGIYRFLSGDRVVAALAVNPGPEESRLERLERGELRSLFPNWELKLASDPEEWRRAIFQRRLGREVWRPLVLFALAVLLLEGLLATAGRARRAGGERTGAATEEAISRAGD